MPESEELESVNGSKLVRRHPCLGELIGDVFALFLVLGTGACRHTATSTAGCPERDMPEVLMREHRLAGNALCVACLKAGGRHDYRRL